MAENQRGASGNSYLAYDSRLWHGTTVFNTPARGGPRCLPCRISTRPNFLSYWEMMRRGKEYNLILDDAHFTDYRAQKMGYVVLAKIPNTVTYSLIVPHAAKLDDPARLVGRRIATLGIPSIGAAQLNGLFTQPSKQPIPVEVDSAADGFALLRKGKVAAAILPTPLVREEIVRGSAK